MKNLSFCGDCFDIMPQFEVESIDMILADLPYGVTACKWDSVLPFDKLWENYKRLIKKNGAIVLFGTQPFTSALVMSNPKMFKYELIWEKSRPQGFAQAPYKFMGKHESILIFSFAGCSKNAKPRMIFNPQGLIYKPKITKGKKANATEHRVARTDQKDFISYYTNYPNNILKFDSEFDTIHPTQKPVELLKYLIKTYTNEGMTVLDNTAGSLSTAIACLETNRNYIVIEKENKYYDKGQIRIKQWHENNANKLKLIL